MGARNAHRQDVQRGVARSPENAGRCTTTRIKPKICRGWFGAKRSKNSLTFRPREMLLNLHKCFFFFLPFFVFCCFCHPSVIVPEVVFCLFLRILCFQKFVEVVFPSSFGSPYLSSCFDTCVKPGCQSKTLLVHLFSGREAILLAIRQFSLLCVSIQQRIFVFLCVLQLLWCFF